jgi:hypothetical protein
LGRIKVGKVFLAQRLSPVKNLQLLLDPKRDMVGIHLYGQGFLVWTNHY